MISGLLNLKDYTSLQLTIYGLACAFWVPAYLLIIRNIVKYKFAPIPAVAWCGFFAWEILWGFVYRPGLGDLVVWGLKVYAPLSFFILWGTFRYGQQQFFTELLQRNVGVVMGFALVAWLGVLYFFIPAVDDPSGLTTAAILCVVTGSQYIHLLLKTFERDGAAGLEKMSYPVSWFMLLANIFSGIFCYMHMPERRWLTAIWCVVVAIDVGYVLLFSYLKFTLRERKVSGLAGYMLQKAHI